jgi:hypothetical protein
MKKLKKTPKNKFYKTDPMFLQTTAGHNRGPPQQSYYLGSIWFMKKNKKLQN